MPSQNVHPGIDGRPDGWQSDGQQTLGVLKRDGVTLDELAPVVVSELMLDVERLFEDR